MKKKILFKQRLELQTLDSAVEKWFDKFKRGKISTEDEAHSEIPKEAIMDKNSKKVHKIIFDWVR